MSFDAVPTVRVVLPMFAALPNPHWALDPAEVAPLIVLVEGLEDHTRRHPRAQKSGYKGFDVFLGADHFPLRVYGGVVSEGPGRRLDPERAVERFLLDTGVRQGAVVPLLAEALLRHLAPADAGA